MLLVQIAGQRQHGWAERTIERQFAIFFFFTIPMQMNEWTTQETNDWKLKIENDNQRQPKINLPLAIDVSVLFENFFF